MSAYSVFETEHNHYFGDDENGKAIFRWIKQLAFYYGDMSGVDVATDSRFKFVNNKRNEAIFMGLKTNTEFPVKFPFTLDNGVVLDEYEQLKYNDE